MSECERLKLERDVYKDFSEKIIKIMVKYEISTVAKLDKILMEQRVW